MIDSTNQKRKKIIESYLSGSSTEEEITGLFNWLSESEDNRRQFAAYKKIWIESRIIESFDVQRIENGRDKVGLKIEIEELNRKLKLRKRISLFVGYAASIILLAGLFTGYYFYSHLSVRGTDGKISGNIIEVPYGSKSHLTLPDGSKVWLNAGSKISYKPGFGIGSREVYLEGEAYFDIEKNENIPFYVKTDLFNIKVYGTAFNVKSYLDEDISETTLDRGAISIIRNDMPETEIKVVPNQRVVIHRNLEQPKNIRPSAHQQSSGLTPEETSLEIEENVNTKNITAWKDNRLVFEQEPLVLLAKRLERRYNVIFHFSDEKMKSIRYTAVLKEMPIDQVLKAISMTSPIKYKIDGMEVTLMENPDFKYQ